MNVMTMPAGSPSKSKWVLVFLWLLSLIILLAINQYRNGPAVLADELGYLGVARYLAGAAALPDMYTASFYHIGYSIFIVPAFWLGSDPVSAYHWVMVINAMLAASVAPLSYVLARQFFAVPHRRALVITALVMLYPSIAVQTNMAWSENPLTPLFLIWVMLFMGLPGSRAWRPLTLSLVSVFLFFIHPRALGLEILVLIYFAMIAIYRRAQRGPYIAAAITMIVCHELARLALASVRHMSYASGGGNIKHFLEQMIHLSAVSQFLPASASGQLLYVSYASAGMCLLGLLGLLHLVVKRCLSRWSDEGLGGALCSEPMLWVLLGIFSIFFASIISMATGVRVDHWFYGRYVEITVPILLIAGATQLWAPRQLKMSATWGAAILISCVAFWYFGENITDKNAGWSNIPAMAPLIFAMRQNFGSDNGDAYAIFMMLTLAPMLLLAAAGSRARMPILLFYILNCAHTIYVWPRELVGRDASTASIRSAQKELQKDDLRGRLIAVVPQSFTDAPFVAIFYRIQYFIDQDQFKVLSPAEAAKVPFVVAPLNWRDENKTYRVIVELTPGVALWKQEPMGLPLK